MARTRLVSQGDVNLFQGCPTSPGCFLESAGFSTWTVTGNGLLGHPRRAPYDDVISTSAMRHIPYTWIRRTNPGGIEAFPTSC
jgi:protein-L-isoaspartate O-methyltransferase